jgi:serine/threonine-protein phosphatase 2A regulatory subunit B'
MERDYLKTIVHRLYSRFMMLRSQLRKIIVKNLIVGLYDDQQYGQTELLEILKSIIDGFQLPLKQEHRQIFEQGLIPLHSSQYMRHYHNQLTKAIIAYIQKDETVADLLFLGCLKFWPKVDPFKETIFLKEIEIVLL